MLDEGEDLLLRVVEAILDRQRLGEPERHPARNDRHLVHRIRVLAQHRDQRVARLVIGGHALVLFAHDHAAAFCAEQDLVLGRLEVEARDAIRVATGGEQRRLVDQVLQVRAREARRATCDHVEVDVLCQRHAPRVDLQDREAAAQIGSRYHDAPIETSRAQQRGIEHVRSIRRGDQDHAVVALEAVHLHEQLVERLLALVVTAAEPGAAVAAHRVDLVDEDDAGRVLLALLEQIANARRAHADEHLDEVGARDGEEGNPGLARDGSRKQRLAGSGRPDEQHPLRDAATEARELLRLAQERDDLFELGLRLLDAGDIGESDALRILVEHARPRLAEAHRLATPALHLADEEHPETDEEQQREPHQHHLTPEAALGLGARRGQDFLGFETLEERTVDRGGVGGELAAGVGVLARDVPLLDRHRLHFAGVDLLEELGVGDLGRRRLVLPQHGHQQQDDDEDDDPQGHVFVELLIHCAVPGLSIRTGRLLGAPAATSRPPRFRPPCNMRETNRYRSDAVGKRRVRPPSLDAIRERSAWPVPRSAPSADGVIGLSASLGIGPRRQRRGSLDPRKSFSAKKVSTRPTRCPSGRRAVTVRAARRRARSAAAPSRGGSTLPHGAVALGG